MRVGDSSNWPMASGNVSPSTVFNMGHRLEIFPSEKASPNLIRTASTLGIEAKVVGRVEASSKKELIITCPDGELIKY